MYKLFRLPLSNLLGQLLVVVGSLIISLRRPQLELIPGLLTEWCRLSGQDPDYWPALKGPGISVRLCIPLAGTVAMTDPWSFCS